MMKRFRCVTRWSNEAGEAFDREHEREAVSGTDAFERERAHNARLYFRSIGERGWNWEIQSVAVLN